MGRERDPRRGHAPAAHRPALRRVEEVNRLRLRHSARRSVRLPPLVDGASVRHPGPRSYGVRTRTAPSRQHPSTPHPRNSDTSHPDTPGTAAASAQGRCRRLSRPAAPTATPAPRTCRSRSRTMCRPWRTASPRTAARHRPTRAGAHRPTPRTADALRRRGPRDHERCTRASPPTRHRIRPRCGSRLGVTSCALIAAPDPAATTGVAPPGAPHAAAPVPQPAASPPHGASGTSGASTSGDRSALSSACTCARSRR